MCRQLDPWSSFGVGSSEKDIVTGGISGVNTLTIFVWLSGVGYRLRSPVSTSKGCLSWSAETVNGSEVIEARTDRSGLRLEPPAWKQAPTKSRTKGVRVHLKRA